MDDGERELLAATFDLDAKGYDDGRPDHPVEAWDIVLRSAGLRPNYRVLEIGPAAPFTIETCSLETADLVAGSFDAVFAATSFHWVDPEVGVPILRRVLKPGAPLCLWWNVYRDPAAAVDAIDAVVRAATELPNTRGLNGILDELRLHEHLRDAGFREAGQRTIRWTGRHTAEELVALFRSFSDMRKRHHTERDIVLAGLRHLVRANGGAIERPCTTPILLARAP